MKWITVVGLVLLMGVGRVNAEGPVDQTLTSYTTVTVENQWIWCIGDQPAIRLAWPDAPSVAVETAAIRNVTVVDGALAGLPSCAVAIDLINAWNSRIENVTLWTIDGNPMIGIRTRGRSNDIRITGLRSDGANVHLSFEDLTEGVYVADARLISGQIGVRFATQPGRPGGWIVNSHMNVHSRGILVSQHPQVIATGNLIYRLGTSAPFIGIDYEAGSYIGLIQGNIIHCGVSRADGLAIKVTTNVVPSNNTYIACR